MCRTDRRRRGNVGRDLVDRVHAGHVVVLAAFGDLLTAAGVALVFAGDGVLEAGTFDAGREERAERIGELELADAEQGQLVEIGTGALRPKIAGVAERRTLGAGQDNGIGGDLLLADVTAGEGLGAEVLQLLGPAVANRSTGDEVRKNTVNFCSTVILSSMINCFMLKA
jgi:hypothetical protein